MMGPSAPFRALTSVAIALCLVFAHPVFATGLLEKNHPLVEAGMDAYDEGRYADALAAFEAAKREHPDSAVVDFNLGNTLYRMGRYEEAKDAWLRASKADEKDLKQKDYFNLGNGFAAMGKDKEAIAAYRKALTLDPNDGQARHNLEVLLRKLPPKTPPDAGTPDAGPDGGQDGGGPDGGNKTRDGGSDGGTDGGDDGGAPDGGTPNDGGSDGGEDGGAADGGSEDGGSGDGGAGDGGADGGSDGGGESPQADGGSDGGQQDGGTGEGEGGADGGADGGASDGGEMASEEPSAQDAGTPPDLSQQDANKVLDSMERNEKNLQLWRFQQRKKPRNADEKDW